MGLDFMAASIGVGLGYQYAFSDRVIDPDERHLQAGYLTLSFNVGF